LQIDAEKKLFRRNQESTEIHGKKISPQIPQIGAEKKLYGRNQESAEKPLNLIKLNSF